MKYSLKLGKNKSGENNNIQTGNTNIGQRVSQTIALNTDNDDLSEFNEYLIAEKPFRFVILIITSLLYFASSFQWVNFNSLSEVLQKAYKLSSLEIYLFSNLYLIVYVIMFVPSFYLIEKKSLKFAIKCASLLTLVGGFFKSFINTSMAFAYVGQIMCAIGRPLIMNAPAKIASNWFRQDRRVMATSFIVSFNVIGVILSFLLPTWYFENSQDSNTDITPNIGPSNNSNNSLNFQFRNYTIAGAIITLCFCFPSILLMKSKPDIPPSVSQQNQKEYDYTLFESVQKCINRKSFVFLLCSFTCTNGFYYFYPVIITDYLKNYNISFFTTSYLVIVSCLGGLVGLIVLSILVDIKRMYRLPSLFLNFIMISVFIFITFFMEYFKVEENNKNLFNVLLLISFGLYGFCLIPLFSIAMDFACELTYPVGESVSSGLMYSSSHLLGFLSTFLIDFFLTQFKEYKFLPNLYSIMLFAISLIFVCLSKDNLIRKKEDENRKLLINNNANHGFVY